MNSKISHLFFTLLLCMFILSIPVFASGAKNQDNTGIYVTGIGTVSLEPDTASISLAVVTLNNEASKSAQMNADIMTKVISAVKALGIADSEISTTNFSMYQESNYNKDGTRTLGEYRVKNNVKIIITDIDNSGDIIDAALSAGANQLSSINFYASDTKDAYTQARKLAIQQATDAAKVLAKEANCKLGKPISITEQSNASAYKRAISNNSVMLKAESMSTPVAPSSTDITINVSMRFSFK